MMAYVDCIWVSDPARTCWSSVLHCTISSKIIAAPLHLDRGREMSIFYKLHRCWRSSMFWRALPFQGVSWASCHQISFSAWPFLQYKNGRIKALSKHDTANRNWNNYGQWFNICEQCEWGRSRRQVFKAINFSKKKKFIPGKSDLLENNFFRDFAFQSNSWRKPPT